MTADESKSGYKVTLSEDDGWDSPHRAKTCAKWLLALLLSLLLVSVIVVVLPRAVSVAMHALERFSPLLERLVDHRSST